MGGGTVKQQVDIPWEKKKYFIKDLKFADKGLKGHHFRAYESYTILRLIGNQIPTHFDLYKSLVAQLEAEIAYSSEMQH